MIDGHVNISSQRLDDGGDCRPESLLAYMDEYGVEKAVIALGDSNEYISGLVGKHSERLRGLASFHVRPTFYGMHGPCSELEAAVEGLGLSGLKVHPGNMGIRPDDLCMVPLLRKAADLGVPVMIHSNPWGPAFYEVSAPHFVDHVARLFPDLRVVIAHLGGTRFLDTVKMALPNVWAETSSGLVEIADLFGVKTAERVLRKIGFDHLIYGSDFPLPARPQLELIQKMDLTEKERDKIFHENAEQLFFA